MKTMKNLIGIFLLSMTMACATDQQDLAQIRYDEVGTMVQQQVDDGSISKVEAAHAMATAARELFPLAYGLHDYWDYNAFLHAKRAKGQIDQDDFDYLWRKKQTEYNAAVQFDSAIRAEIARQAEAQSNVYFLQNIGSAFRKAYGQ